MTWLIIYKGYEKAKYYRTSGYPRWGIVSQNSSHILKFSSYLAAQVYIHESNLSDVAKIIRADEQIQ